MSVDHYMMFGTFAEQRHFVYPSEETYNGVIFNANMVAHAPAGLAGFLVTRTNRLSYFIDPLTHAFQHAPSVVLKDDTHEIKKAFDVLASAYGEPIRGKAGVAPLVPADFYSPRVCEQFVTSVLDFQRTTLTSRIKEHSDCKYFSESELVGFGPSGLVAPYFYIREYQREEWLRINLELISLAKQALALGERLFAEIVLEKDSLSEDRFLAELAARYVESNVDGFFVWIDDFDEHLATRHELASFLELCRTLRTGDKEVINLHGSYFSVLAAGTLGSRALTGVTHGPEFGEARAVVPVGGGLPFAKFYLPLLHERVKYRDLIEILRLKAWNVNKDVFHEKVCDCPACIEVVDGDFANFIRYGESTPIERRSRTGLVRIDYPTQDARMRCLKHYLQCKAREYRAAADDGDALRQDLQLGIDELGTVIGFEGVKHLHNWQTVLADKRD